MCRTSLHPARPSLQESLFLGFCAVFILFARSALRLHLHLSGHSMVATMFFLMLGRACVSRRLAASTVGLIAGMMALLLGLGRGGLLVMVKFLLPAVAVDLFALMLPGLFVSFPLSALTAAAAAATKFLDVYFVDRLVGMDSTVAFQHASLQAAAAIAFGVVGGLCVPPVVRRLKAYGVL